MGPKVLFKDDRLFPGKQTLTCTHTVDSSSHTVQDLSLYLVSFMNDAGFSPRSKFLVLDSQETLYPVSIFRGEIAAKVLNPWGQAFLNKHPDRFRSQKYVAEETCFIP